jgi:hypothetical protein
MRDGPFRRVYELLDDAAAIIAPPSPYATQVDREQSLRVRRPDSHPVKDRWLDPPPFFSAPPEPSWDPRAERGTDHPGNKSLSLHSTVMKHHQGERGLVGSVPSLSPSLSDKRPQEHPAPARPANPPPPPQPIGVPVSVFRARTDVSQSLQFPTSLHPPSSFGPVFYTLSLPRSLKIRRPCVAQTSTCRLCCVIPLRVLSQNCSCFLTLPFPTLLPFLHFFIPSFSQFFNLRTRARCLVHCSPCF